MLIQCRTYLLISHSRILLLLLLIAHLEPPIRQEASDAGLALDLAQVVSQPIFDIPRLLKPARRQRFDPLLRGRPTE